MDAKELQLKQNLEFHLKAAKYGSRYSALGLNVKI